MKKIIVLSLGGSQIIPNQINLNFLNEFKQIILSNEKNYKFVIVCGGGKTARNYIKGLKDSKQNKTLFQSFLGISITRLNARFMSYFFERDSNKGIPHDMKTIKNMLQKHPIVFCGALRYSKNQTSDTTAAKLANYFKSDFINITNVKGLYDKDPKKSKNAKLIKNISHTKFLKLANQIAFSPGQHFVLDQSAAKLILKNKTKTYIIGSNNELNNLLQNKKFTGTLIN